MELVSESLLELVSDQELGKVWDLVLAQRTVLASGEVLVKVWDLASVEPLVLVLVKEWDLVLVWESVWV